MIYMSINNSSFRDQLHTIYKSKIPLKLFTFAAIYQSSQLILWCLYLATYKIRCSCSPCGDFIDRGRLLSKKLVDYTLENWTSTFESFIVVTMIYYNITILPFHSCCVTYSSVGVYYIQIHQIWPHRIWYTRFDLTGYDWLSSWFHDSCV